MTMHTIKQVTLFLSMLCFTVALRAQRANTEGELRVLTYNIHHANPPSRNGVIDIDSIAGVIKKTLPDLVAIQEVDVFTNRSGKAINECDEIASRVGLHGFFAKAINYDDGAYGVSILSRFPILKKKIIRLPTITGTNGEPRIVAAVLVKIARRKKIWFACTHLDAQRNDTNRVAQINVLVKALSDSRYPVIIGGDFNDTPGSATIRKLDASFQRSCTDECDFTIPETNPRKTIDYIAFQPREAISVVQHKVINESYASDHRPVFTILNVR
jgi:endonuclease/exonuclease/phosphatase family metal-dependent hydrolase